MAFSNFLFPQHLREEAPPPYSPSAQPVQQPGFLGRHKVTIISGLTIGITVITVFALLAFPPVGLAVLLGKVTLASLPLAAKIVILVVLPIVSAWSTAYKMNGAEDRYLHFSREQQEPSNEATARPWWDRLGRQPPPYE